MRDWQWIVLIITNEVSRLYDGGYGTPFMDAVEHVLLEEEFDKDHPDRKSVKGAVCRELNARSTRAKRKLKRRRIAEETQKSFRFRSY